MRKHVHGTWLTFSAFLVCLLLARGRCEASPSKPVPAVPTARAWEFTDIGGTRHAVDWLARERGGVLVYFFDLKSPESLLGLNFFDALFVRARDFGLSVIGVEATGRAAEEVRALLQGYTTVYGGPSFPVIADPDFTAAKIFGSQRTPTALLIGDRGELVDRCSGFDLGTAAKETRVVEKLLRRDEGFFSPALRDVGLSELKERQLSARAETAEEDEGGKMEALAWGDRVPAFDFTDSAGRPGRWAWPGEGAIRVAFFWSGASPNAAEDLAFFQGLHTGGGREFLEIIAVESTGLGAEVVAEIFKDFTRRHPASSFPVVADPQRRLVGAFGAGDPLPQTFLVGGQGEVLYRADGFDSRAQRTLEEKISRAVRFAGLGLAQAVREAPRGAGPGADRSEAPSISRSLELAETLRLNLSQGDYYFSNVQYDRAILYYQRYLELDPSSLHALVRLAQCHDLIGEPVKGREYWERVLALRPNHTEARARVNPGRRAGVP